MKQNKTNHKQIQWSDKKFTDFGENTREVSKALLEVLRKVLETSKEGEYEKCFEKIIYDTYTCPEAGQSKFGGAVVEAWTLAAFAAGNLCLESVTSINDVKEIYWFGFSRNEKICTL